MQDRKNILIAALLCAVIWLGYEMWLAPMISKNAVSQSQNVAVERKSRQGSVPGVSSGSAQGLPSSSEQLCYVSEKTALAQERVSIEGPFVKGSICLKGATLDDWVLKDYKAEVGSDQPLRLLKPLGTKEAYFVRFGQFFSNEVQVPDENTVWKYHKEILKDGTEYVHLYWVNDQGVAFDRHLCVQEKYGLFTKWYVYAWDDADVPSYILKERQDKKIKESSVKSKDLYNKIKAVCQIERCGPVEPSQFLSYQGPLGIFSGEWKTISYEALLKKPFQADIKESGGLGPKADKSGNRGRSDWFGFSDKYWLVAMGGAEGAFQLDGRALEGKEPIYRAQLQGVHKAWFFLGPKQVGELEEHGNHFGPPAFKHLEWAVDFGWFYFITKPLFYVLSFFKNLLGSFGAAILLLTVIVRVFFFPLAIRSARSMYKMKKIQPAVQALRERFKGDKVAMNHALIQLYQKDKINPVAGFLPLILQFPIFFALYKVLFVSIEMRQAPFWGWISDLASPDPTSFLNLFGLLPFQAPSFLHIGVWPFLMGVSMLLQQKGQQSATLDPAQRLMLSYVMPVVFVYMMADFPAGMIIYWTWNNILSFLQQWVIEKVYLRS